MIRTGCGSEVCCSCAAGSGTLPVRRGETFAAVSGAFLLHLKPPRSERNPCCFLPILPSFLPPRGLRPAKPVAAPTSEAPYKNAKRDAADRMAASSLCFSGTARAPAAKLLLIVLSVIPPKTVKVSAESFLFPIFFFRRMGALVPLQSPFLPNLLRPNLLRPEIQP